LHIRTVTQDIHNEFLLIGEGDLQDEVPAGLQDLRLVGMLSLGSDVGCGPRLKPQDRLLVRGAREDAVAGAEVGIECGRFQLTGPFSDSETLWMASTAKLRKS
jgi:hypothetical protein